ncbi:hypothetical protein L6164_032946 [Bauhinia variegata]|uniref:Uncharacterized protein n=1 Tax=Bauhinia variegata TaxID=167791 RepID=A0ACB9KR22_BAUVA|nr:hypothetical protein L6164_032946 [Bauhinia variegata]
MLPDKLIELPLNMYGAAECGRASPEREAWKLAPSLTASQDRNAPVSDRCCGQVKKLGENPACFCACAAMLSNAAKNAGVNAETTMTIPKRCNIVCYKCGGLS